MPTYSRKSRTAKGFKADKVGPLFSRWLERNHIGLPLIAAGKNFAKFDLQFLTYLPNFHVKFHHRSIDPAMLYWRPGDDYWLPSTEECIKRGSVDAGQRHRAVEDAMTVVKLVRAAFAPTHRCAAA